MKVAIIGAGAMGCLFGAKLAQASNDVLLIDHDSQTVAGIRKNGIQIRENKTWRRVRVAVRKSPGDLRNYDLILIMVKGYSTRMVARQLRGGVGKHASILTLQNGLGNMETLSRMLGSVLAGSTTEASLRIRRGAVEHTGYGSTLVGEADGSMSERAKKAVQLLRGAGFSCQVTGHARKAVWSKAVLNSAINPVSALTGLRNGSLLRASKLKDLMVGVVKEASEVGRADGVSLDSRHLSLSLFKVLRLTARNQSSMLQDVLYGRKTEVRELNGKISELGRRHGIPAPLNNALLSLIIGLEKRRTENGRRLTVPVRKMK